MLCLFPPQSIYLVRDGKKNPEAKAKYYTKGKQSRTCVKRKRMLGQMKQKT